MHQKIVDIQQKAQAKIEEEREKFQKKAGGKVKGQENLRGLRLTDWGNAERLVARHGQDLRYCYPWNRWLVWDGRRWAIDEVGVVEQRAKDVVRSIYQEAAAAGDKKQREALAHHALASESEVRRKAMVASARNEPGIPVLPEQLDQAPWLFNVFNGTLDLQSGKLMPHRRADLITKLAPVEYDPQAQCPTWWTFLEKIMNNDGAMMEFLQKSVGYALTGDTREQCLFFLYGLGATARPPT